MIENTLGWYVIAYVTHIDNTKPCQVLISASLIWMEEHNQKRLNGCLFTFCSPWWIVGLLVYTCTSNAWKRLIMVFISFVWQMPHSFLLQFQQQKLHHNLSKFPITKLNPSACQTGIAQELNVLSVLSSPVRHTLDLNGPRPCLVVMLIYQ